MERQTNIDEVPGFLPGTFFLGGQIYCYANFSFAVVQNFRGAKVIEGGEANCFMGSPSPPPLPCGRKPGYHLKLLSPNSEQWSPLLKDISRCNVAINFFHNYPRTPGIYTENLPPSWLSCILISARSYWGRSRGAGICL